MPHTKQTVQSENGENNRKNHVDVSKSAYLTSANEVAFTAEEILVTKLSPILDSVFKVGHSNRRHRDIPVEDEVSSIYGKGVVKE